MHQKVIISNKSICSIVDFINNNEATRIFLVCDNSMEFLDLNQDLIQLESEMGVKIIRFSDFQPNPLYYSIVKGVDLFRSEKCDIIIAIGGGSTIDVAKCIKLFSNLHEDDGSEEYNYLNQVTKPNNIPFLALPTTAGTGSEATKYAVIYYNGEKQSITDESIIPNVVVLDSSVLKSLPMYQRKATMMDALSHAIESFWSINSTEESRKYSYDALHIILKYKDEYLANTDKGNLQMLIAANKAGMAINITQTTAGHAMCYKITSLFHVAHGHAAILCNRQLFPWMIENIDLCIDPRGKHFLTQVFNSIAEAMGCDSTEQAVETLNHIFAELELSIPEATKNDFEVLKNSVNVVRLKNHPIQLNQDTIDYLYHRILDESENCY